MNDTALTLANVVGSTQFVPYDYDSKQIKLAKKHFMQTGELLPFIRHEIGDSWRKCRAYGLLPERCIVRPIPADKLGYLKRRNALLIQTATKVIDAICRALQHIEFVMTLSDAHGNLIYQNNARFYACGFTGSMSLRTGNQWLEQYVGTNSISLALQSGDLAVVYGAEHFWEVSEGANCVTAPIRDNYGSISGTVTITYYDNKYNKKQEHQLFKGMVTLAVLSIETTMQNNSLDEFMRIAVTQISEGVLHVNRHGRIKMANKYFASLVNTGQDELIGCDVHVLFPKINFGDLLRKYPEYITIPETTLSHNKRNQDVRLTIYAVLQDESVSGYILFCKDIKGIMRLSQKYSGSTATTTFDSIITEDKQMHQLIENCMRISNLNCPVLIEGASGTGKELFANAIHSASERCRKPFVAVNCAALPINLVESELFGYDKGSFTGGLANGKIGKFELANEGTIFLDEIGEMPLDIQGKLLRVLDNHMVTRIGGTSSIPLDIRVIAATNRDLRHEVERLNFRADLYYRLNVMNFKIPSLNERSGDILILAQYFLNKLNQESQDAPKEFSPEVKRVLLQHQWVGNVRELQSVVMRSYYLCVDGKISLKYLPNEMQEEWGIENYPTDWKNESPDANILTRSENERTLIIQALRQCDGKVAHAAAMIHMPKTTIYRKIKQYKIIATEYRN